MDHPGYLDLIRADSERLLSVVAAGGPDLAVPTCPDWRLADLVRHVGQVYEHKILCMELDREPEPAERTPPPTEAAALPAWYAGLRDDLLAQLAARDPATPTHTWFPPDQTVGFWYRRMAHETAIHRTDAEAATGDPTPLDPEAAVDGIDELLGFIGYDFGDTPHDPAMDGRTVELSCGTATWTLVAGPGRWSPTDTPTTPDARLTGTPADLLLHLWGRLPTLTRSGDPAVLAALHARLGRETG